VEFDFFPLSKYFIFICYFMENIFQLNDFLKIFSHNLKNIFRTISGILVKISKGIKCVGKYPTIFTQNIFQKKH
jgi:hypothetical protein